VCGGGDIIPDRVLPYRKDASFIYYNQLQNTGLMNRVAFEYVRGNVEELLRRYADADAFYRSFEVPGRVVEDVVQRAEKAGVKRDGGSLMRQSRLIKNRIKAYIGMSLYGDGAFYRILLDEDDDLRQLRGK
jgi:carboxyl-terminal processing protease